MSARSMVYYNEQLEAITGLLRNFNVWPKSNRPEDVDEKLFLTFLKFVLPLYLPGFVSYFLHLRNTLKDIDLDEIYREAALLNQFTCLFTMVVIYLYKLKRIVGSTNDYSELEQHMKIPYRQTIKILQISLVTLILILGCLKYFTKSICQRRKQTSNAREVCGYLYPCHFIFDSDHSPIYEIILLHQVFIITLVFSAIINVCMLMIYFVEKYVSKLKNIQDSLKRIDRSDLSQSNIVRQELAKAVEDHNYIITGIECLNNNASSINFTHFVMGSLVIALFLLDFLTTKNIESISQVVVWLAMFCLISVICQSLINEGENLEEVLYDIRWYEMNIENQRTVHLMLLAAQRPLGVNAGPVQTLQLTSLLRMYRVTYSYLNLLFNTLDKIQ